MRLQPSAPRMNAGACPHCGAELTMPMRGRGKRSEMVVQVCRAFETCGLSTWSEASAVVISKPVDDGSRHGRYLLPVTSEPEPAPVVAPDRWASIGRFAQRELDALNRHDRKLAAAGGDR